MERHFTHLHLHTEFSLLDGAISLDNLVSYGKKHNLKALAEEYSLLMIQLNKLDVTTQLLFNYNILP